MKVHELKIFYTRLDEVSAQQRIDIGDRKFLLFCKEDRSMICGFNSHFCSKIMKKDGTWTGVADSYQLGIATNFSGYNDDKKIELLKDGFKKLQEHLEYLYLEEGEQNGR